MSTDTNDNDDKVAEGNFRELCANTYDPVLAHGLGVDIRSEQPGEHEEQRRAERSAQKHNWLLSRKEL